MNIEQARGFSACLLLCYKLEFVGERTPRELFDKKASLLRNLGEQIGFAPKAQICFANPNLFLPYPLEPSKTFAQG
ncbi:MAG: hypothetical protein IJW69_01920, partial [Clostridia bacterium]|nr:hypothetical protein [Clostridia bacterium]